MKHRSVVANFLFKNDEHGDPIVALFRRSHHPDVHTYQGKLAPISGSIDATDPDALAAAIRELHEETQFVVTRDYELRFSGAPFTFADPDAQRSWTVHPFGWKLIANEDRIKLDWEHSGWQWVHPDQILDGIIADDCVPRLDDSLRRVYFGPGGIFGDSLTITRDNEGGKTFLAGLQRLRSDKENGARVIATEAVKCFKDIGNTMRNIHRESLTIAAYHLIYSGRPSMNSAISSAVLAALKIVNDLPRWFTNTANIMGQVDQYIASREQESENICKAFATFIRGHTQTKTEVTILTLSSSSTISAAILHLLNSEADLRIKLKIFESRPLCEGASMAATIHSAALASSSTDRLSIQIAPDSHLACFASRLTSSSVLVLGADRISPSGHVSNKTGSAAAAIVTKTISPSTKVIVLSETDKIAKPSNLETYEKGEEDIEREMQEHSPEANDVAEVTRIWAAAGVKQDDVKLLKDADGSKVKVQNSYFEWVHRRFINAYICETGVLGQQRIRDISLEKGRLERQIFASLYD